MKIGAIIAVLSRLLTFILGVMDRRREAFIETEVSHDASKDAEIADLVRAGKIRERVDDVRLDDRMRRTDTAGHTTQDGYRD